jgi:hypothetical protein
MNLIEISEQLKDVPDQLLMKEVQAPSGAYPAYLVVTEMSRRKRMRDQAVKEAPTTTVAQDLSQPSREQLMAAMAAMQGGGNPSQLVSPEAPPVPRQAQGMSQPAPRLNATGIMAAPQANQALAAQDVMGAQEPRRMAAGGMVAFAEGGMPKYDSRGAVLFQNQGVVPRYGMRFEELPEYRTPPASSLGEMFSNFFTRPGQRVDPYTNEPIYLGEFLRRQDAARAEAAAPIGRAIVENTVRANPQAAINMAISNPAGAAELARRDPIVAQHLRNAQLNPGGEQRPPAAAPAPAAARGPAAAPGGGNTRTAIPQVQLGPVPTLSISPFVDPYAADAQANLTALRAFKEPTPQELERARVAEENRYGEKVPFRYGFLEKDIAKREKDIEGRKSSNVNEALIQTGLGIMGSKSPRFLQAAGEAGTAGLNAYRQGLKDIREGEKDILQSKTAFANAQTLYDQGKFTAGEKAEEKANKTYERGLNRLNTESAILARNQNQAAQVAQLNQQGQVAQFNAGIAALGAQREAAKLPYELAALREQAGYYSRMPNAYGGAGAAANRLSDADQNKAEEAARTRALMSGKPFGSAEYQALYNQYYAEELQRRGAGINYQPPSGAASTQGGNALPPGWSVQVQPAR